MPGVASRRAGTIIMYVGVIALLTLAPVFAKSDRAGSNGGGNNPELALTMADSSVASASVLAPEDIQVAVTGDRFTRRGSVALVVSDGQPVIYLDTDKHGAFATSIHPWTTGVVTVKVYQLEKNGDWQYSANASILVG